MSAQIHRYNRDTGVVKIVRHAAEPTRMLTDAMDQTDHMMRRFAGKMIALYNTIPFLKIKKLIHCCTSQKL